MFHQFFVQIEEIHDAYYRNEHIESNKCDTTSSDSKDFISNGNMEYFENDVPEKFDMNSPDHNVFDNVEGMWDLFGIHFHNSLTLINIIYNRHSRFRW